MKNPSSPINTCRHCRYYQLEGRRGGHCQQLNVLVQSSWKACAVALPPFVPTWDNFQGIIAWQQKSLAVQEVSQAACVGSEALHHGSQSVPVPQSVPVTSIAPTRGSRWM